MARWRSALIAGCAIVLYSCFFLMFLINFNWQELESKDIAGIFCFLMLMILVNLFPIEIKGTTIVFTNAVSIAAFLQYGFWIEAILTQLAILVTLLRIKAKQWERYVANLTMFLIISVCSAGIFYLLGGRTGPFTVDTFPALIVPTIGYLVSAIFINHLLFKLVKYLLYNQKPEFFGRSLWWEIVPLTVMTPTGLLIYVLYAEIGVWVFLYVVFPLVSFSVILRLYHRLNIVNEKFRIIHDLGNDMTSELQFDHVVDRLVQAVSKLVPYQYCYLFRVDHEQGLLKPVRFLEQGIPPDEYEDFMRVQVEIGDGLSGQVASLGQTKMIGREEEGFHFRYEPCCLHQQQSILSVPLKYDQKVYGVLTVCHNEPNRYTKEDVTLMEILASQAAIAFKNAYDYQQTKQLSERDELTGLYNYRYFSSYLSAQLEQAGKERPLALILLDIDHFKQVNDQYGHLAGNEILRRVAALIQEAVGEKGIVARYGGEEFTILIENITEGEAYRWAEQLRARIEQTAVEVVPHLNEENQTEPVLLNVTVSIGLALYPQHADDPFSLMRRADRAMYLGAKRKGRNKVAVYPQI
ncbi:diguanylate cyclase with GAF sensor [Caldalkalibacillus thermarum TA2.A1]|uniref:Diguanylate cyclase with GAF sensor n=1 Tax=Caldalkalibacillus thermarum (strain TA2.A1) TaxID=986075 RepID=F5LAL3_CALTT|nr:sensor domain-containing diguanylate cyclase [Caldalkalibacillus thermarum]EGL81585.1 diguanylate cyclase with GAF sensor [Caldalkalibacillus thermarum TA2.A1]QZT33525.1 sensor domain-containing diguanylate cyclase [Caldalkalibacillus thermarum TA2.A1]